jgi:hypothetical protein
MEVKNWNNLNNKSINKEKEKGKGKRKNIHKQHDKGLSRPMPYLQQKQ